MAKEDQVTYRCIVMGSGLSRSRNNGTPSVKFKLFAKFDTSDPTKEVKINLYADLWLTPNTVARSVETLQEVFGWDAMHLEDLNEPIFNGREVDAVCEPEEYNGQTKMRVKFLNKPSGVQSISVEEMVGIIQEIAPLIGQQIQINQSGDDAPLPDILPEDAPLPSYMPNNDDLPF